MTSQKNVGTEGLISVLESQAHLLIYSYHLLDLNRPELDLSVVTGHGAGVASAFRVYRHCFG